MARAKCSGVRSRGFTLLEVIIAFVIMALIVGATFDTFSTGLRNAVLSGNYADAVVRAESRLALLEFSEALDLGVKTGRVDQTYGWRTEISPVVTDEGSDRTRGLADYRLYHVVVTVFWGSGRDSREVTLRSQRLKRAPR